MGVLRYSFTVLVLLSMAAANVAFSADSAPRISKEKLLPLLGNSAVAVIECFIAVDPTRRRVPVWHKP